MTLDLGKIFLTFWEEMEFVYIFFYVIDRNYYGYFRNMIHYCLVSIFYYLAHLLKIFSKKFASFVNKTITCLLYNWNRPYLLTFRPISIAYGNI